MSSSVSLSREPGEAGEDELMYDEDELKNESNSPSSSNPSLSLSSSSVPLFPLPSPADVSLLTAEYRSPSFSFPALIKRAEAFIEQGQQKKAAFSLLFCLEKFRHSRDYTLLARCLSLLSSLLYENKRFDKAIEFKAAERLVYENSLLALTEPTESCDSTAGVISSMLSSGVAPRSLAADERRAQAFERLARMFFKEKQIQLAKEYAMKAIDLRRRARSRYGDPTRDSESSIAAQQLAQAGKEEYEQALRKYHKRDRGQTGQQDDEENDDDEYADPDSMPAVPRLFELGCALAALGDEKQSEDVKKENTKEKEKGPADDRTAIDRAELLRSSLVSPSYFAANRGALFLSLCVGFLLIAVAVHYFIHYSASRLRQRQQ